MPSKLLTVAILLAVAPCVIAQPPVQDARTQELQTLQREFSAAQQKYYEPYRNVKTEKESQAIKLDPAKNPAHVYLPKFQALADQSRGTTTGMQALFMVSRLAGEIDRKDQAKKALQQAVDDNLDKPGLEQAAGQIRYAEGALSTDEIRATLEKIVAKSPHRTVQAAALYYEADLMSGESRYGGKKTSSADLFRRVKSQYGDTRYGKMAEGAIFEAEHLVVGKVAPDFQATDQDNKPFKLSDYRGKVVVIDFWGFW